MNPDAILAGCYVVLCLVAAGLVLALLRALTLHSRAEARAARAERALARAYQFGTLHGGHVPNAYLTGAAAAALDVPTRPMRRVER